MGQFTGATVEEAIEKGLVSLGISRLEADITVISRGKKGFLGFFKKPAYVNVSRLVSEDEKVVAEKNVIDDEIESELVKENVILEQTVEITEQVEDVLPPVSQPDISVAAKAVSEYIQTVIYEMDLDATIETTHHRRAITLQIETSEPGRVIGYHGKVLKSLQLLAQNFLHDRYSKYFLVSLNVNDYNEHRTETLIEFSRKISEKVLETGRDYEMDPMTNSERKTVHKTITRIDGVVSYSEGSDPNRYVVVTLSK